VNCYASACRGEKKSGVYTIIHDSDGTRRGPLNSEIGNRAFYSLVSKRLRKSGPQTKVKVTCIEVRAGAGALRRDTRRGGTIVSKDTPRAFLWV
jgi:hypothetical protein